MDTTSGRGSNSVWVVEELVGAPLDNARPTAIDLQVQQTQERGKRQPPKV
jgi:hypothetical protein